MADSRETSEEDKQRGGAGGGEGKAAGKKAVPASAYHNIGRPNYQAITQGVLSARTNRSPMNSLQQQTINSIENIISQKQSPQNNNTASAAAAADPSSQHFNASIQVKRQKVDGKVVTATKLSSSQNNHLIDHSQLFIEPSPRNLIREVNSSSTVGQAVQLQPQQQLIMRPQQTSQQQQNWLAQQRLLQSNQRSTTPAAMDPIFTNNSSAGAAVSEQQEQDVLTRYLNYQQPSQGSQNHPTPSKAGSQLNSSHGTAHYGDLINGPRGQGNIKAMTGTSNSTFAMKKENSLYKKGQSDIAVTQLLISHQEGINVIPTQVEGRESQQQENQISVSDPKMQISIQEKSQMVSHPDTTQTQHEKISSDLDFTAGGKQQIQQESRQVSVEQIDQLQQTSVNEKTSSMMAMAEAKDVLPAIDDQDEFTQQQQANPFHVQSFISQKLSINQEKSSSVPSNNSPAMPLQPSSIHPQQQQPVMTDQQVRVQYSTQQSKQLHLRSYQSPRKGSETYIKQVMQAPRLTNYQVLKRPKTNRENQRQLQSPPEQRSIESNVQQSPAVEETSPAPETGFPNTITSAQFAYHLNRNRQQQKGAPPAGVGVIPQGQKPQQDVEKFYRIDKKGFGGTQSLPMTQQGKRPGRGGTSNKMVEGCVLPKSHQRMLASQGSLTRPMASNVTAISPSRTSKKFVGGFGGAGSVFTHSHLTNTRKHSHYRMTQGGQSHAGAPVHLNSLNSTVGYQGMRMSSQDGLGATTVQFPKQIHAHNSSGDSMDLKVAGNKPGTGSYLHEPSLQTRPLALANLRLKDRNLGQHTRNVDNLPSKDTSRSPIPIDPESYKNMNMELPPKMYASSNNLAASHDNISQREGSISRSSGRGDPGQPRQVKPFIMSPQNLQETLQSQQQATRAGATAGTQLQGQNPFKTQAGQVSPRNAITQHGKRSRVPKASDQLGSALPQHGNNAPHKQMLMLNQLSMTHGSAIHHQPPGVMKGSAKRLRKSTADGRAHNSSTTSKLAAANAGPSQHHPQQKQPQLVVPRISGHQVLRSNREPHNPAQSKRKAGGAMPEEGMSKHHRRFKSNQLQSSHLIQHSSGLNNNVRESKPSPKHQQPESGGSLDAVKVNKINIAVNPAAEQEDQLDVSGMIAIEDGRTTEKPDGTIMDHQLQTGEHGSLSGLTQGDAGFPALDPPLDLHGHQERGDTCTQQKDPQPQSKHKPVLKSKSYLIGVTETSSLPIDDSRPGMDTAVREPEEDEDDAVLDANSRAAKHRQADASAQITADGPMADDDHQREEQPRQGKRPSIGEKGSPRPPDGPRHHHSRSNASDLSQALGGGAHHSSSFDKLPPTYARSNINIEDALNSDLRSDQYHLLRRRNTGGPQDGDEIDQRAEESSDVDPRVLWRMLRSDQKDYYAAEGGAGRLGKELGTQDLVAMKTSEFLAVQTKLGALDYNSLASDRSHIVDGKVDLLMKDIAITGRKRYSQMPGLDGQELFDVNQRRNMQIKTQIPMNAIKFKNKSEQTRYSRIVNCIIGLNDQTQQKSQNDIEFTYTKIFRFLADLLTPQEFEKLSYYHVSRFIGNTLKLAFEEAQMQPAAEDKPLNQQSLRQHICKSLDLQYQKSSQSRDLLNRSKFNMQSSQIKKIWSKVSRRSGIDPYDVATEKQIQPFKQRGLKGNAESRHRQIQEKVTQSVKCFAHEPRMNAVISDTYFQHKETIQRSNLARLLKSTRQTNDLDYQNLNQMSTLARNQLVLEHVVGARNLRDWKAEVLEEIHLEQRSPPKGAVAAHKRTQSQALARHDQRTLYKRIL